MIVDRAWLAAHGRLRLVGHLSMQHSHQLSRAVIDAASGKPIGLGVTTISWKRHRRNGGKAGTVERFFWVDGHTGEIGTLDEALEILAIQKQAEAGHD